MNVSTNQLTPAEQAAADRLPILVSLRGDASAEAARAEVAAATPIIAKGVVETVQILRDAAKAYGDHHPTLSRPTAEEK